VQRAFAVQHIYFAVGFTRNLLKTENSWNCRRGRFYPTLAWSSLKPLNGIFAMKTKDFLAEAKTDRSENVKPAENRILVVDDDSSVREMLTRVLIGEGYLVSAAADGTSALEIAASAKIDLVLLDLNMPGKSGWDTFERLTAENPLLPVIIVTARANQLFTAMGAGVGALLEKPLHFPKLLQTIQQLLAEPAESRLARMAGDRSVDFHYVHGQRREPKRQKQ
jgi:CheY-like chemotaxis protein